MKSNLFLLYMILILSLILTGCLYPDRNLPSNQIAFIDQVKSVQSAVIQFQEDNNGILPIKTKDGATPIFEKYPVDFNKIVPEYLAEPPSNSFEMGGVFQYVLVDVETNPQVKIFDLRIADTIREIKLRIRSKGYPPYKEEIAPNVYSLDFKKLGYKQDPVALSPFTRRNLPFVISSENAEIYVDYRIDLLIMLKESKYKYKNGEDIRGLLIDGSMFVPAFSLPYTVSDQINKPIFLVK